MSEQAPAGESKATNRRGILALGIAAVTGAAAGLFARRNGAEADPGPISGDSNTATRR